MFWCSDVKIRQIRRDSGECFFRVTSRNNGREEEKREKDCSFKNIRVRKRDRTRSKQCGKSMMLIALTGQFATEPKKQSIDYK